MGDPNGARRAGFLRRGSAGRLSDFVDDQISCACVGRCWGGSVLGEESEHDSAKSRTVADFRAGAPGSWLTGSAGLARMERGGRRTSEIERLGTVVVTRGRQTGRERDRRGCQGGGCG